MNSTIEEESDLIARASALRTLYEEVCVGPFPYQGIRELFARTGKRYEGFVPDLDHYFSTIAGYCGWGKRIVTWDEDRIEQATKDLAVSFFDKHPSYKTLETMIAEEDLVFKLGTYEKMRLELLKLLKQLASKATQVSLPDIQMALD